MFPTTGTGHASGERIVKQSMPGVRLFVRRIKQFPYGSYCAQAWGLVFQSVIHLSILRVFQQTGSGPAVVGDIDLHLASAGAVSFIGVAGAGILWWRKKKPQSNMRVMAGMATVFGRLTISECMNFPSVSPRKGEITSFKTYRQIRLYRATAPACL